MIPSPLAVPIDPRDPRLALLTHPDVTKIVHLVLRDNGLRSDDDLTNFTGETHTRVLEAVHDPSFDETALPDTVDRWKAYVRPFALGAAVDEMRRRGVRHRRGGTTDAPDDHAARTPSTRPERPDIANAMKIVASEHEAGNIPEHGIDLIDAKASKVKTAEAAAELGIPQSTARKQRNVARTRLRIALERAGYTLAIVTGAGAAVLAIVRFTSGPEAHNVPPTPSASASAVPSSMLAKTPTPHERAEALVDQAVAQCAAMQWNDCDTTLQRAVEVDPYIRRDPRFDQLENEITNIRTSPYNAKPGAPGR